MLGKSFCNPMIILGSNTFSVNQKLLKWHNPKRKRYVEVQYWNMHRQIIEPNFEALRDAR